MSDARLYGHDPDDGTGGAGAFFLLLDEPEVYGLPKDPKLPSRNLKSSGTIAAASGAVMGLLAIVGLRKRRMDEIGGGDGGGEGSQN